MHLSVSYLEVSGFWFWNCSQISYECAITTVYSPYAIIVEQTSVLVDSDSKSLIQLAKCRNHSA